MGMILFRGEAEPVRGLPEIPHRALAAGVHQAEVILGRGAAGSGGAFEPGAGLFEPALRIVGDGVGDDRLVHLRRQGLGLRRDQQAQHWKRRGNAAGHARHRVTK